MDKIMGCDPPDDDEQDTLLWLFENNVLHPRASSFIYFPEHEYTANPRYNPADVPAVITRAISFPLLRRGRRIGTAMSEEINGYKFATSPGSPPGTRGLGGCQHRPPGA